MSGDLDLFSALLVWVLTAPVHAWWRLEDWIRKIKNGVTQ
jgi:hypothetical protein